MTNQRIWDHYQSVGLHRFASAGPRLSYLLDRAAHEGRGRPLRILNVGIGDATLERLALARGWEVDALDPSKDAVARSMAMGIRAHHGVIEAMPFADASFDAVFCSEVFEHLASDQLQAALPEIGRVLRPDGRLYGTVPFDEHLDEQRVASEVLGDLPQGVADRAERLVGHNEQAFAGLEAQTIGDRDPGGRVEFR